jgi:hypothetical protein
VLHFWVQIGDVLVGASIDKTILLREHDPRIGTE